MKTNMTMTKRFLFAIALLAVVVSSCKKDEVVPAPDVSGVYKFTSAELIDGNIGDTNIDSLFIENGGGPGVTSKAPVGDVTTTSFWVNAVLSGLAPCENVDPRTWTYEIDIKSDGKLAFTCTSENNTTEENGTWKLEDENKTLTLIIESATLGQVIVKVETATFVTGATGLISGTINKYPMLINAGADIGAGNVQYIAFKVVLTKK